MVLDEFSRGHTSKRNMTRSFHIFAIILLIAAGQAFAQSKTELRRQIEQVVAGKKATVGVAIADSDGKVAASLNGDRRFPMQSVFKLHIGLKMLSEIDKGRFSLDQKIEISKSDLLPDLYSPIRDRYPEGATLSLAEILGYTISASDNVGCELLLKLLGGPAEIERYFVERGFRDVSIKVNEVVMQANWDRQFENWTTPNAANQVLRAFYANDRKLLSVKSREFLWKVMRETETGADRLKGRLPAGTVVAHKTGSSGVNKTTGVTAAVNDIGVVFLPNGRYFFISVFVTDSTEDAAANEKIIADIARAAWDHFAKK